MIQYEAYLESNVLTASPLELVRMLYRFVIDQLNEASRCLDLGNIEARGKAVTKATDGILELMSSLDHSQASEVSASLAELYGYCASRILQGHIDQDKTPFLEVANLMSVLLQGWEQVKTETTLPASSPYETIPAEYSPINASF